MDGGSKITLVAGLGLCLSACATPGGYPYYLPKSLPLSVVGVPVQKPMVVRGILKGSPADGKIRPGDMVVAIGRKPVKSIEEFLSVLASETGKPVTLCRSDGSVYRVPYSDVADPIHHWGYILPTKAGETLSLRDKDLYGRPQAAGMFFLGNMRGLVKAEIWKSVPNYLEVQVDIRAKDGCSDCTLKNIAVLDEGFKSFLSPVRIDGVMFAVFPQLGRKPPAPMPIPAPTVTGYNTSATTVGTVNASIAGSRVYGNISANTVGTVAPTYDYSMTDAALAYNLGAVFQRAALQDAVMGAKKFIADRQGNIHVGKMNPGERETGYLYYSLPPHFTGPYVVYIVDGEKHFFYVRFKRGH